jgi:hypothetical protein
LGGREDPVADNCGHPADLDDLSATSKPATCGKLSGIARFHVLAQNVASIGFKLAA